MNTVLVSDVTLKQMLKNKEDVSLCERKKLIDTLSKLGVNAIELPPASTDKQSKTINRILAQQAEGKQIRIPIGYTDESFASACEVVDGIDNVYLQIEYPLSTVQLEYLFKQKAPQAIENIEMLITQAKTKYDRIELIANDATRADRDILSKVCEILTRCGVKALTLCDDTESAMPDEIRDLVSFVSSQFDGDIAVQISDKSGLALACACAAIDAGAKGVKTSMLHGDCLPIDSFANLIHLRGDGLGFATDLNVTCAAQTIASYNTQNKTVKTKASASIEQEKPILDASSTLADIEECASQLGYELSDEDLGKVRDEMMRVIAKKGAIGMTELEAVIAVAAMAVPSTYHVDNYVINSGNIMSSTAQITLVKNGEKLSGVSIGDGPIDAAFQAIEQIIGHHYELEDFQIHAVTQGREALGNALVKLRAQGRLYSGNGVSTDIVGASIRAYINALNKIVYEEG